MPPRRCPGGRRRCCASTSSTSPSPRCGSPPAASGRPWPRWPPPSGATRPARCETVGVTGTNGKTTVTQLVGSILEAAGRPTEVIGTLGGTRTTPESPDLQHYLAECGGRRDAGRGHGGVLPRPHPAPGGRDRASTWSAFTNLSRDHLDHHGSMEAYFEAKASLFAPDRYRHAVVFADDPWGARLLGRLDPATVTAVRRDEAASVSIWRSGRRGSPGGGAPSTSRCRVASTWTTPWWRRRWPPTLGVDEDHVVAGLGAAPAGAGPDGGGGPRRPGGRGGRLRPHAGRASMRRCGPCGRWPGTVGCCACSAAAATAIRASAREMGAVATALADVVVLTSDNPRSEDPMAIIAEVRAAWSGPAEVAVEPDRAAAIRLAVGRGPSR